MGAHRSWKPTEKAARVANGFERQPVVLTSDPFGPMVGVSIYPPGGPPEVDMMPALNVRRRRA
jgi:hypothetical protein